MSGKPEDEAAGAGADVGTGTRAAIYRRLSESGEAVTVRDVAAEFDLHPNVARTHLQRLAALGVVRVDERKRPEGGRPARVYQADPDAEQRQPVAAPTAARDDPTVLLLVRLLSDLVEHPGRGGGPHPLARAHETALAEGRRLVEPTVRRRPGVAATFVAATEAAVAGLREVLPDARVAGVEGDAVDVDGVDGAFAPLAASRPRLARALERGLLAGALAAAGVTATISDHDGRLRLRPTAAPGGRSAPPAGRVDARGLAREEGVRQAQQALAGLDHGQALEVLADGPGSPAAFARWADRAGHQLVAVERVEDAAGPAIRLVLRKGD